MLGLTRGNTRAHIVRAALEGIAYQTRDVVEAMVEDVRVASGDPRASIAELRVDGGAAENDFLMQFQADQLGVPVNRPKVVETTALGAAYLAGLGVGLWNSSSLEKKRARDKIFRPRGGEAERDQLYRGWKAAVGQVRLR